MEKDKDYSIKVMDKRNIAVKEKAERQVLFMKNYYSKIDNITLIFSDIEERDGFDSITSALNVPTNRDLILRKGVSRKI